MTEQCTTPVALNARIDPELHRALKMRAAESGKSMRELIELGLRRVCDMNECADQAHRAPVDEEH